MGFTVEYSECVWCLNAGYAIVPDLRDVQGGAWGGKHTCAVFCRCYEGRKERERHHGDRRSMALEDYERHNPGWQSQLWGVPGEVEA
jgi:hypothetical protein